MQTIKRWVRSIIKYPRHFKWWYQRARRGYSDCDAWNADKFLAGQIAGMLILLVKNTHGVPMSYADKNDPYGDDVDAMAIRRDKEYLKHAAVFEEYAKNGLALDKKWEKQFGGVLDKDIQKSLKWFSKHFSELWD